MEITFIVLSLALLLGLGLLTVPKAGTARRGSIDKHFVKTTWDDITATAARPDQSARFAVIEADKLLDYALKARGYKGETMGDRLRAAGHDFSYTDDVWHAHKLRNKLVHEAEYQVDARLINRAIGQFYQALKDLGAL